MTITPYEPPAPLPATTQADEHARGPVGWVARLRAAAEIANYIGDTDFVKPGMRGNPAAIAAAILYGQEIGIEPMQALRMISIIKGNPAVSSEGQRAQILAEGHEIWFEESTVTRAIAAGRRRGSERVGRITFTMDDAKRAGLAGQPAYRNYPAEMLRARASAALARTMFPDVIGGLEAAEELDGEPDNGAIEVSQPDAQEPPTSGRTRKRRTAAAPKAGTPTPTEPVVPPPPPDTQPDPGFDPMEQRPSSEAQRRQMFALMRDVGLTDRDERLEYTQAVIGRELDTSTSMTVGEASLVIDALHSKLALRDVETPP